MSKVEIIQADLENIQHQRAVVDLVDAYARDPFGNGKSLTNEVRRELIPALRRHPTTLILLAFLQGLPVGIAVCFLGFSTFAARRLINIHDLAVLPDYRGHGIGRLLLEAVEEKARALGCCKLTLEVDASNQRARQIYLAAGFGESDHIAEIGRGLFMTKPL